MPGRDGTGPLGMGPGTGRGFGPCVGRTVYPYAGPFAGYGAGYGLGFGRGRGFRRWARMTGAPGWTRFGYPAAPGPVAGADPAGEKAYWESQAKYLEDQLGQVKDYLNKLGE